MARTRQIKIEIAVPNREIRTFSFDKNVTVEQVLETAGLEVNGEELDFNGRTVNHETKLRSDGTLTVIPSVKGG